MPNKDGKADSAAPRVNITRCPFAPEGALSEGASTTVNTPRNSARFGCPSTSGISTAMLSSSITPLPIRISTRLLCPSGVGSVRQSPHPPHLIHSEHSVLQQNLLNLRLLQ